MLALNRGQLPLTQSLLDRIEALELAQIPSFQHTFAVRMCFDV